MLNSSKFNINSIRYLNDPRLCPEEYLDLLANKYGFEYDTEIYKEELRIILSAFKRIVLYKGSILGIKEAINCFMCLKKMQFRYSVFIDTFSNIEIVIYKSRFNVDILTAILRYVMPTGCGIDYRFTLADIPILDSLEIGSKISASFMNVTNTVPKTVLETVPETDAVSKKRLLFANGLEYKNNTTEATYHDSMIINTFNETLIVSKKQIFVKEDEEIIVDNKSKARFADGDKGE